MVLTLILNTYFKNFKCGVLNFDLGYKIKYIF